MNVIHNIDIGMRDLLSEFGFCGYSSLYTSLLRIDNVKVLSFFAGLGVLGETALGLKPYSLVILLAVLLVELGIGILSGVKRTRKFRGRMLQRFGLKVFLYFLLLLVFTAFKNQYSEGPEFYVYSALHSFLVFYIIGVYCISILENASYLLGGSKEINGLLRFFRIRMKKVTEVMEDTGTFGDNNDLK